MPTSTQIHSQVSKAASRTPALLGGAKAVTLPGEDLFHWPIITAEDEAAVLDVLRKGTMSGWDITQEFEREFSQWIGTRFALAHNTGTAALHAAMFGIGLGRGDELICPAQTYWASCLQAFSLGATVVFADIDPNSFCINPADIEHRITSRTKAIVAVHFLGHPCDMDPIMALAGKHGLKVIEDISHAQGGHYKGRKLGTMGDVAGISLMTGKSFAIGEGGMLVTDNLEIYERALAFGHYERFSSSVTTPDLKPFAGLPLGGHKYRMHQMSSAVGRVQLKHYDARIKEIRQANDYFWSRLEGVPGIRRHQITGHGSDMAGLYSPKMHYIREEVGGMSLKRFAQALEAEGFLDGVPGLLKPLNLHPLFNTADVYRDGKPTRVAFSNRPLAQPAEDLPVSLAVNLKTISLPWFKKYRPAAIDQYAEAYRKVLTNWRDLLKGDPGDSVDSSHMGATHLSKTSEPAHH